MFDAVDDREGDEKVATVPHLPHLTYVKLLQYVQELWRAAQSCKDVPEPVSADRIKVLRKIYECCIESHGLLPALLLNLAQDEDHVCGSSISSAPTLTF